MFLHLLRLILPATLILILAQTESAPSDFPADENPRYFPADVFTVGKYDGSFQARWYASQLRALDEPSLSEVVSSAAEPVYRFTWLRSFRHPIAVRVAVHADGTGTLTAKMADGSGGYKPGKLIANTTREIGVKEVRHLLDLIDAMEFWRMPVAESGAPGCDGAEWIVEASSHGRYHVIERWTPAKGPIHDLGLYLALTLGKLDVPASTIY